MISIDVEKVSGTRTREQTTVYTMDNNWWFVNPLGTEAKPKNYATGKKQPMKLVVTDVDGTLTNGQVVYGAKSKFRSFSVIDGHGFQLLRENGFDILVITGENDKCIEKRMRKLSNRLDVDYVLDVQFKADYIAEWYGQYDELYVIGDDVNDLDMMQLPKVVIAATPKGSVISTLRIGNIIELEKRGGDGAFREFAEMVLMSNRIDPYKEFRGK